MSRRFKGYAVRDDEGRWLGHVFTEDSVTTVYGDKANRRLWESAEDADEAARFDVVSLNGFVVVPVFAVRKPKPAPVGCGKHLAVSDYAGDLCGKTWLCPDCRGKPAPVAPVVAGEGRYAVISVSKYEEPGAAPSFDWLVPEVEEQTGPREQCVEHAAYVAASRSATEVVRILADGEHEAAVAEARAEAFAIARGVIEFEVVQIQTREHLVKKLDEAQKGHQ